MSDLRIVIVQEKIPNYRIPFFEGLSEVDGIYPVVIYCGNMSDSHSLCSSKIKYQKVSCHKLCLFRWHSWPRAIIDDADVLILMFDIHWLTCIILTIIYKKKTILWGHGLGHNRIGNLLRKYLIKICAAIITYEDRGKDILVQLGCNAQKIYACGNTVLVNNPSRRIGARTQFIYVGRLQPRKAIVELIIAFSLVEKEIPINVGLTIVGDGDIADELKSLAIKLGVMDKIDFTGAIHDESVLSDIFAKAIAYVSPRHVGLGVLHSFAHGVPVITSKRAAHAPEVENIIHGANGLFYQGGVEGLAEVLRTLGRDPEKSETLGINALYHYQNKRTMKNMISNFVRAIRSVKSNMISTENRS